MNIIESVRNRFSGQPTKDQNLAVFVEHRKRNKNPKLGFVFPGQGSQEVGMGYDLFKKSAVAKATFEEADDALGLSLSRLCFEGPQEELRQTINAQPAILTMSIACLREARVSSEFMADNAPAYIAGHSLGEYTAMVAANAIKFRDAVRLVRERGRLMQMAGQLREGGMAAILGLDGASVERICWETGAQIANINSENQIVLSGSRESLVRAMDLGRAMGANRIVPLDVSGAFHSSLMGQATEGMAIAISQTPIDDPESPIIANSDAAILYTHDDVRIELNRHLCSRVDWPRSVRRMNKLGVEYYVEIGPKETLTTFIKRTYKQAKTAIINDLSTARREPLMIPA